MDIQNEREVGGNIIQEIFFAIRHYWIWILIIVVLSTACGVGYSYIKKPNYTAGENVVYKATNNSSSSTKDNVNLMGAYFNTVLDFCDEGVVIDRANFYYLQYRNSKLSSVDEFINTKLDVYRNNVDNKPREYFIKSNISTSVSVSSADSDNYAFVIKYTDPNAKQASEKVKILIEAIKDELTINETTGLNTYFGNVRNNIIKLGSVGVSSDVNKTRLTFISFVVGLFLSAVIVYLRVLMDNTVNNKQMLEHLSGVPVLALIDKEGGKSYGKRN